MAAIITDTFRRNSAQNLFDRYAQEIDAFVGIGKSDPWNDLEGTPGFSVPHPVGGDTESLIVKENLAALVRISSSDVSRLIPRNRLILNRIYKVYDPTDSSCFYPSLDGGVEILPCYVEHEGQILLILENNNNSPVTAFPNLTFVIGDGGVVLSGDDYRYAWCASLPAGSRFITQQFVEVRNPLDSISNDPRGLVFAAKRISGGSGYTSATATLVGRDENGDEIADENLSATIEDGEIVSIQVPIGLVGYAAASIEIDGDGEGAHFVALSNTLLHGFATKPLEVLPSWFVGFAVDFIGRLGGSGKIIPFRQISIIEEPEFNEYNQSTEDTSVYNEGDAADALKYFVLDSEPPTNFPAGVIVEDTSTGARGWVDKTVTVDVEGSPEYRVYFHQNDSPEVNFKPFDLAGGTISINGSAGLTYSELRLPEYEPQSGKVIFLENRPRIDRNENQTEEIRIVIQL